MTNQIIGGIFMNLKKVSATMISMLMATGMFAYMPLSNDDIDTLTQLKGLNITPFNGIQVNAESNFRRPLSEKQLCGLYI